MTDVLNLLALPGLSLGLVIGGVGAYFLGVRDPFLVAGLAVGLGIVGLIVLDLPISSRKRRRKKPAN